MRSRSERSPESFSLCHGPRPPATPIATRIVTREVASRRTTAEPPSGSEGLDWGRSMPTSKWKMIEAVKAPTHPERAATGS